MSAKIQGTVSHLAQAKTDKLITLLYVQLVYTLNRTNLTAIFEMHYLYPLLQHYDYQNLETGSSKLPI